MTLAIIAVGWDNDVVSAMLTDRLAKTGGHLNCRYLGRGCDHFGGRIATRTAHWLIPWAWRPCVPACSKRLRLEAPRNKVPVVSQTGLLDELMKIGTPFVIAAYAPSEI